MGCGRRTGSLYTSAFVWGDRVELWRASDWLKNDKHQLKVQRADKLGCTWAVSGQKQVQSDLDQWHGSWGAFFTSFQSVLGFVPKRTRYTCFWPLPFSESTLNESQQKLRRQHNTHKKKRQDDKKRRPNCNRKKKREN